MNYSSIVIDDNIGFFGPVFKLLEILAERRGWVFSRDEILSRLWGDEKAVIDRTVDVHITNLRKKLGKAGRLIENVRGVGYKLTD